MYNSCILFAQWGLGLEGVKFLKSQFHEIKVLTARYDNKEYGCAVYNYCIDQGIEVVDVLTAEDWRESLLQCSTDFLISVSFGFKIPKNICANARYASINFHQSLLPKFRGPDPLSNLLIGFDQIAGVSVHALVEEFDAGPIYTQMSWVVCESDTLGSLNERCKIALPSVLGAALSVIFNGGEPIPQDEALVSYAPSLNLPWDQTRAKFHKNMDC